MCGSYQGPNLNKNPRIHSCKNFPVVASARILVHLCGKYYTYFKTCEHTYQVMKHVAPRHPMNGDDYLDSHKVLQKTDPAYHKYMTHCCEVDELTFGPITNSKLIVTTKTERACCIISLSNDIQIILSTHCTANTISILTVCDLGKEARKIYMNMVNMASNAI